MSVKSIAKKAFKAKAITEEEYKQLLCVINFYLKSLRPQVEWIPVSERLPEEKLFNPSGSDYFYDFEEVLCTTIWGDVRAYKFGKTIGHDKPHFWFGARIMDEYVIAWQYKPEPYKEAHNNELMDL